MEVKFLKAELSAAKSKESEAQALTLTLTQELRLHDGELKALSKTLAASREEVADIEVEMATANSVVKALQSEKKAEAGERAIHKQVLTKKALNTQALLDQAHHEWRVEASTLKTKLLQKVRPTKAETLRRRGRVYSVQGQTVDRGRKGASLALTSPQRTLTSSPAKTPANDTLSLYSPLILPTPPHSTPLHTTPTPYTT